MSLREGDLRDTVLKKLSIDEFEPKTGQAKDVMVLGFYVNEQSAGDDLYHFISGNPAEIRDVEVSPNSNDDGYYMVFVELDRKEDVFDTVKSLIADVEKLAGKLAWQAKTYLNDDYIPLDDPELTKYVITDPSSYVSREEFEDQQAQLAQEQAIEEAAAAEAAAAQDVSNQVLGFLKSSNLLQAGISENRLHMQDARNIVSLEFVAYGQGDELLKQYGIHESAIKADFDKTLFSKLKSMLGEMAALPIDRYVVIYNPADQTNVLITKAI
jgi:hypothetical protein